jgi:hypothetical protein
MPHGFPHQDKKFGVEVVDLAKDPLAAGPLARSTTRNSNPDKAPERLPRSCGIGVRLDAVAYLAVAYLIVVADGPLLN